MPRTCFVLILINVSWIDKEQYNYWVEAGCLPLVSLLVEYLIVPGLPRRRGGVLREVVFSPSAAATKIPFPLVIHVVTWRVLSYNSPITLDKRFTTTREFCLETAVVWTLSNGSIKRRHPFVNHWLNCEHLPFYFAHPFPPVGRIRWEEPRSCHPFNVNQLTLCVSSQKLTTCSYVLEWLFFISLKSGDYNKKRTTLLQNYNYIFKIKYLEIFLFNNWPNWLELQRSRQYFLRP